MNLHEATDVLIAALETFKANLDDQDKSAPKTPQKGKEKGEKSEVMIREIDKDTGEITEHPRAGYLYTGDCPFNRDICKISDKEASLSRIRFREVLCSDCFKAHK